MLEIKLSEALEKEYRSINQEFVKIRNDWKKYADEIIPENKLFAKRIIKFIMGVIDYVIDNFDSLALEEYQEFLTNYHMEFYYGPNGDDRNYLDLDESLDGEPITEFFWELRDEDYKLTKDKLKVIKEKFTKILQILESTKVKELKKRLEKLSIEELDKIIDSIGISTTEDYEEESKNDKIGTIIAHTSDFSDEELEKII